MMTIDKLKDWCDFQVHCARTFPSAAEEMKFAVEGAVGLFIECCDSVEDCERAREFRINWLTELEHIR